MDAHPLYARLTIFSPEDQTFIEITILHLYVKFNSSPLCEAQSASQESIIVSSSCITKWLRLYDCLRILPKGSSQP